MKTVTNHRVYESSGSCYSSVKHVSTLTNQSFDEIMLISFFLISSGRGGFNSFSGGGTSTSLFVFFFILKYSHLDEQQTDTIFVSGLPDDVEEMELSRFFGSIGIIKVRRRKP